ncbi:hypothetical protein MKZ38_006164 [Zalerion maritima]|uniref:ATP-dependent DNA helicase II subunit 2 n=1 Tax=Zalerion maritima TaxID=339359 RepID=A0AAD5WNL5_9PEZI|nr:hypothetical protein MKZ38_006164 [Zalerion maritima]
MADKEATVYILDLGSTMGDCNSGRVESDLTWSMRYVWDKIGTTVAASRKTWCVGVIGLRTTDTFNPLQEDDGYDNISILQPLAAGGMTMSHLRELRKKIFVHDDQNAGDAVSAIVVAVDMIEHFTKKLKYKRKIVLVTDGMEPIDGDDFDEIAKKMGDSGIELVVLGVDFDDPDYGYKQEDKPKIKKRNEELLSQLCDQCGEDNAVFGTMAEAIDDMSSRPRLKPMRPYKNYDGLLTLGRSDGKGDDDDPPPKSISISVERYFKTHLAKPVSATTVVARMDDALLGGRSSADGDVDMDGAGGPGLTPVHNARTYKVPDASAPGGKKDVEFDALAKGYEYGRTAVHISESEHNITKLETTKSFTIVGFVPWDRFEPFLLIGECCQTIASRFMETSSLALSSLINALWELESFAVARIVAKDGKEPQLVLLMPGPTSSPECLYDVPLPFAEDVRNYQFPPLDKVVTISGATLAKHRNLPSDDLLDAMGDYVDAMDLSSFPGKGGDDEETEDEDGDGEEEEYCAIEATYNPTIHRFNAAIRTRATQPDEPIGEPSKVLLQYSHPPEDLVAKAKPTIDDLIATSEIKKVPPKIKGRKGRGAGKSAAQLESEKPLSGLDIDALLSSTPAPVASSASTGTVTGDPSQGTMKVEASQSQNLTVDPENSIPTFKQALRHTTSPEQVSSLVSSLGNITRELITDSLGDVNYDRAAENMRVMRDEMIAFEEPGLYNAFVKDLKKKVLSGELGGDRREMWWQIRGEKLGLITEAESEVGDTTAVDAREFYTSR